jgi:DNA (cytosine-5)-methyltransferase 1
MLPDRPTLVSLFTGAGGLDIGLEQAGFCTVTATDSDPDCVATLRHNQRTKLVADDRPYLEGTTILLSRVEDLEPEDLRPAWANRSWVPDLLAGGPPCQPFSSSGKMLSLQDPRGRLFEHFVRLATGLQPRLILFENVRGLVTAKGPTGEPGEAIHRVKEAFETIGYATRFALLNAADFGCPQRRVRCFMIGARDTSLPVFPSPTHAEYSGASLFEPLPPWVTLGEFLASCPAPEPDEIVRPTADLAAKLRTVRDGSGLKSAGAREATRPGGHWGYRQGTFIADLGQPARTITASASQDWIRMPDGTLRRLTLRECAGLQGFPPGWQFVGPLASRFRQVGNAVPSVFGRVIGRQLIEALTSHGTQKPVSAPFPSEFHSAIAYTKREHNRNGVSRAHVRRQLNQATNLHALKGLGSAERASEQ